ncbi:hypothetical protein VCR4J2_40057 [Vibrio coralliirubri]|nr:hypothetical protein VCR4J2_40057 [Vibrio coralliirubri]
MENWKGGDIKHG